MSNEEKTEGAESKEPKTTPRVRWSVGDELTTFDGKEMSLSEAQRRAYVRDCEDAIRNRTATEILHKRQVDSYDRVNDRNFEIFERNVAAQERQAAALERIAANLERRPG